MNNVEIEEFRKALEEHIERMLRTERSPNCQDCIYREIVARSLPGSAAIARVREFAREIADAAAERIKLIQSRPMQ
jgi:hypothetical protein